MVVTPIEYSARIQLNGCNNIGWIIIKPISQAKLISQAG